MRNAARTLSRSCSTLSSTSRNIASKRTPLAQAVALALALAGAAANAQNVDGDSLNTLDLTGSFGSDPHIIDVIPGGETQVGDLGAGCSGYIYETAPDLELEIDSTTRRLGIFVDATIDTTLLVNDPDGNWFCNDDADDLVNSNPGLQFSKPKDGTYDIWVGTYTEGEEGSAKLVVTETDSDEWASIDTGLDRSAVASTGGGGDSSGIDFGDDLSEWSEDGECDDPRFAGEGAADSLLEADMYHDATDCRALFEDGRVQLADGGAGGSDVGDGTEDAQLLQRGRLDGNDPERDGYGYVDSYTFEGEAGTTAVVDLQSADFDTVLFIRSPSGEEFSNDDYEGSYSRSLLSLNLDESGEYTVEVTSYGSDATGSYTLEMLDGVDAGEATDQNSTGSLASGDNTFSDGEYYDSYTFEGTPGQTVTIDLTSNDFDAYLVLETPSGENEVNDDANDGSNSQIVTQLSEVGTYTVQVTSYGAEETGSYNLSINYDTSAPVTRDSVQIVMGESTQGELESSDQLSEDGKYEDVYAFNGDAGETVLVDLRSGSFDTYLSVITPNGQRIDNDDFDGRTDRSVVEFTLQETGRYRIVATTYSSDASGNYALSLNRGSSSNTVVQNLPSTGGSQIYGIFAGMADYPGEGNDLDMTDQDALRARDALIEGAGMNPNNAITLIDSDATNGNFRNALSQIGSQITSNDTLVIFYSGHGSFYDRADGPNNTDPDGKDESIELYDGPLLDDELASLLDGINAGTVLLVFDSCFSGGFAKDVVSAPGRMGLFSSEEDVTSQVAVKFQAGGYLAVFFDEAVRGGYADQDRNSELTAIELSQYLHDRYRADVKAFGDQQYVTTGGPQSSYQHLVVDRGGVGAYNVLFHH